MVIPDNSTVLLEDLVNLTANEMFDGGNVSYIYPALRKLAGCCKNLVMVTNDLFSDGVTYPSSVQEYLFQMAEINRKAAEMADAILQGRTVPTNAEFTTVDGRHTYPAFYCEPTAVTKDNIEETLIDSGYYTAEELGLEP